ncbi:MAG: GtrA family protein [Prolixibacteraceae bacterium]|nr:GtrA family protein [Prolixibacteraceae bacterium]
MTCNGMLIWKFIKFCLVGFSGLAVDFGTTWLLKEKARINRYVANGCGFMLAATSNYILNRNWTFGSRNPDIGAEYFSFFMISLVGLGINSLILWTFSDKLKWNFYLSKVCATIVATLWNFSMNFLFTFPTK